MMQRERMRGSRSATMQVHVSLHDVSPAWTDEIDVALEYASAASVKPALLVVPNFHGAWPLQEHPAFCARLRDLQASGHEIYLHGFFHKSRPADEARALETTETDRPGRLAWLFAQNVVSGGEAEFRDVSRAEAEARLEGGERVLRDAGLTIDGFVAPAWAMPKWLMPLLAKRGYRFTEDHLRIYDPAGARTRSSVVLNYASRSPARLLSTVAYCRIAKYARAVVPARIAIHPADMRFELLRCEVRALLEWSRGHVAARGDELFA
jgi:uncharacterized protein